MAIIGRAVAERFKRRLRLVEGRLGLAEPTWAQFASFFAPWLSEFVGAVSYDHDALDAFKAILEAMKSGECDCDGATSYSDITRWLYGQAVAQMDKGKRGDFRRETERLWQAALTNQLPQATEEKWRQWRNETFA